MPMTHALLEDDHCRAYYLHLLDSMSIHELEPIVAPPTTKSQSECWPPRNPTNYMPHSVVALPELHSCFCFDVSLPLSLHSTALILTAESFEKTIDNIYSKLKKADANWRASGNGKGTRCRMTVRCISWYMGQGTSIMTMRWIFHHHQVQVMVFSWVENFN